MLTKVPQASFVLRGQFATGKAPIALKDGNVQRTDFSLYSVLTYDMPAFVRCPIINGV